MAEVDLVEVVGEDILLAVFCVKVQGPEDLPQLALDGDFLFFGDVAHHLLGDGGTALGIPPGGAVEGGPGGAVPVHALVGPEAVVLNGHHGVHQVLGQVLIFNQLPVALAAVQGAHDVVLTVGVCVIDGGRQVEGHFRQVNLLQGGDEGGVDVCHEILAEQRQRQHTDHAQGEENQEHPAEEARNRKPLLFFLFGGGAPAAGRLHLTTVGLHLAAVGLHLPAGIRRLHSCVPPFFEVECLPGPKRAGKQDFFAGAGVRGPSPHKEPDYSITRRGGFEKTKNAKLVRCFRGKNQNFFNRHKKTPQKLSKSHYRNPLAIFLKTG